MARGNNGPTIQQVIVEMESRGMDVMSILAHAIDETRIKIGAFNEEANRDEGPTKQIASLQKWTGMLRNLLGIQEQVIRETEGLAAASKGAEVSWESLAMSGLKLQDAIRKVAESEAISADKLAERRTRAADRAADAEARAAQRATNARLNADAKASQDADKLADRRTRVMDRLADRAAAAAQREEAARAKADAGREKWIAKTLADLEKKDAAEAAEAEREAGRIQKEVAARIAATEKEGAAVLKGIADEAKRERATEDAADRIIAANQKEAEARARGTEKEAAEILKGIMDEDKRARAVEAATARIIAANEKVTAERISKELADEEKRLLELAAAADKVHDAFLATVMPLESLTDAAMRFKSQRIDAGLKADAAAVQNFSLRADAAARNLGGYANAADAAADRSKRMGQFAMNASYAFQDMQYGLGAFINNVGLLGMSADRAFPKVAAFTASMGGTAGLAAGAMAAGVALDLLWQNIDKSAFTWENFDKILGTGVPLRTTSDLVDHLKDRLEALTSKTWKAAVDYEDIRKLEVQIRKLTEEREAYERIVTGKTRAQQERSKQVEKSLVEAGAGDNPEGAGEKITNLIEKRLPLQSTPEANDIRKQIADLKSEMKGDLQGSFGQLLHVMSLKQLEADLSPHEQREWQQRRERAEKMVGGAGMSRAVIAELEGFVAKNKAYLESQGIDVGKLRQGLRKADDPIAAEKQEKFEKERAKNKADAEKHQIQANKKAAEDAAKEHEDELDAEIDLNLASGAGMKKARIARQKDARERKTEHDQDVNQAVSDFGPGYIPGMKQATLAHAAARDKTPQQNEADLRSQLTAKLRGQVDPSILADVVNEIVHKAIAKESQKLQQGIDAGGGNAQQVAMAELGKMNAAQQRAYMAHLHTLKMQETLAGQVGEGTIRLNQIAQWQAQVQRTLRENNQRFRKRPIVNRPQR